MGEEWGGRRVGWACGTPSSAAQMRLGYPSRQPTRGLAPEGPEDAYIAAGQHPGDASQQRAAGTGSGMSLLAPWTLACRSAHTRCVPSSIRAWQSVQLADRPEMTPSSWTTFPWASGRGACCACMCTRSMRFNTEAMRATHALSAMRARGPSIHWQAVANFAPDPAAHHSRSRFTAPLWKMDAPSGSYQQSYDLGELEQKLKWLNSRSRKALQIESKSNLNECF